MHQLQKRKPNHRPAHLLYPFSELVRHCHSHQVQKMTLAECCDLQLLPAAAAFTGFASQEEDSAILDGTLTCLCDCQELTVNIAQHSYKANSFPSYSQCFFVQWPCWHLFLPVTASAYPFRFQASLETCCNSWESQAPDLWGLTCSNL